MISMGSGCDHIIAISVITSTPYSPLLYWYTDYGIKPVCIQTTRTKKTREFSFDVHYHFRVSINVSVNASKVASFAWALCKWQNDRRPWSSIVQVSLSRYQQKRLGARWRSSLPLLLLPKGLKSQKIFREAKLLRNHTSQNSTYIFKKCQILPLNFEGIHFRLCFCLFFIFLSFPKTAMGWGGG